MVDFIPIDGFKRRSDNQGAIINVDKNGLQAYKLRREKETNKLNEINSIREEVAELKSLLSQVLEKLKWPRQ